MKKEVTNFRSALKPTVDILVSCKGLDGEYNALAVGYACNCSYDPPMIMVGIVPKRYSYHMIKETGEFVVNLVPENLMKEYKYLGSASRANEDKLEVAKMKYEPGKKVEAPILLDCPVNIECKVVDSIMTGSHEMFVGRIEYIHGDENLVDEEGNIDYSKINLLEFVR